MVEPRTAEHQFLQPVHERLAAYQRHALPVTNEVLPESGTGFVDPIAFHQLHEVRGLVGIEFVVRDESKLHGGGSHALLEVLCVESEPVTEELDDVVLAGHVVRLSHEAEDTPALRWSGDDALPRSISGR